MVFIVFIEIVFMFFPVIVVVAHKAEVTLFGVPSIEPPQRGEWTAPRFDRTGSVAR